METVHDQLSMVEKHYHKYQVYEQPEVATTVHVIDAAAAAAAGLQASVAVSVTSV